MCIRDRDYIAVMPIVDGVSGYSYNFLSIDIPLGYAIEYLQLDAEHRWTGCHDHSLSYYRCTDSNYHFDTSTSGFYTWSEGVHPGYENVYYGGWDNISIDFDLKLISYAEAYGGSYDANSAYWDIGVGIYSIWPTSTYEFTLYYQFVPVMPVE